MLVSIFYPPIYYTLMAFVYPWCTQQFSYTSFACAGLCYQVQLISTTLDCFLNYIIPVIVTTRCQFADRCEGFTTEKTHETTKYVEEEYQNGGTADVDLADLHPRMDSDDNFNSDEHVA